jgi:hypothetical protein
MCFSANASFVASAVLIPAGVYCLATAARKDPDYLPLSAIPAVFAIQQFFEALVWVGMRRQDERLVAIAALGFLFFALVFWPVWGPFSASAIEPGKRLSAALSALALLGLCGGLIVFVPLVMHVGISGHSIQYRFEKLQLFRAVPQSVWQVLYVLIIASPLAVRVNPRHVTFNVLLVLTAGVTHAYYWYAYTSVWCFFAALLSAYLCRLFQKLPVKGVLAAPLAASVP